VRAPREHPLMKKLLPLIPLAAAAMAAAIIAPTEALAIIIEDIGNI